MKVSSSDDLANARRLIEMSHDYMVRTKRISLPRTEETKGMVKGAKVRFPGIHFEAKDSLRRTQVIMEVQRVSGSVQPGELLNQAALFLRKS